MRQACLSPFKIAIVLLKTEDAFAIFTTSYLQTKLTMENVIHRIMD